MFGMLSVPSPSLSCLVRPTSIAKKNNAGRYIFHEVGDMLTGIALAYGE
jgi:hypothetical protein